MFLCWNCLCFNSQFYPVLDNDSKGPKLWSPIPFWNTCFQALIVNVIFQRRTSNMSHIQFTLQFNSSHVLRLSRFFVSVFKPLQNLLPHYTWSFGLLRTSSYLPKNLQCKEVSDFLGLVVYLFQEHCPLSYFKSYERISGLLFTLLSWIFIKLYSKHLCRYFSKVLFNCCSTKNKVRVCKFLVSC